jgi:hypothetical protein
MKSDERLENRAPDVSHDLAQALRWDQEKCFHRRRTVASDCAWVTAGTEKAGWASGAGS